MGKSFFNRKTGSNPLGGIIPLSKGGTDSNTRLIAIDNLDAIDKDKVNQPLGIAGLDETAHIPINLFSNNVLDSLVAIDGPSTVEVNSQTDYTIVEYSNYLNYDVSSVDGSVSVSNEVITLTAPPTPRTTDIIVNGRRFTINVVPNTNHVNAPSIVSPVSGASNQGPDVTFTGSSFGVSGGSDTHEGTDWQIATDASFTNIVASVTNSGTNKTSWSITGLLPATQYYVRTRYKGTSMGYSNWSTVSSFTTKSVYAANTEQAKLVASDGAASDRFGCSVSISADGAYAVIGAYNDAIGANTSQGSAYIFVRSGTSWTQQAKLVASDGATNDKFGYSVSISADGAYAVIGAYYDDIGANGDQGSAYIFVRSGTSWTQQAKLVASDGAASDQFGWSVSISADGAYAVIGAYGDDTGANNGQGSAYIFA